MQLHIAIAQCPAGTQDVSRFMGRHVGVPGKLWGKWCVWMGVCRRIGVSGKMWGMGSDGCVMLMVVSAHKNRTTVGVWGHDPSSISPADKEHGLLLTVCDGELHCLRQPQTQRPLHGEPHRDAGHGRDVQPEHRGLPVQHRCVLAGGTLLSC